MDPASIAATAAGLLAGKALETAGGELGMDAWASVGRIADAIRRRFGSDHEVTESLDRLKAKPTSQARADEVTELLQERLATDPAFYAELERLIHEAKGSAGATVSGTDAGVVSGGSVIQDAGGDITGRDRIGDQVGGHKISMSPTDKPLKQA